MSRRLSPVVFLLSIIALASLACSSFTGVSVTMQPPPTMPPFPTQPPTPTFVPVPTAAPQNLGGVSGPVKITGSFKFTNDIILTYYTQQAVALMDMHGFITRDKEWELPVDSQVLGYLNLNPETMRGQYLLHLPAQPAGTLNDVDNDGNTDTGVQVFAVTYFPNLYGDVFSVGDDRTRGWPTYLASVKGDSENDDEIIGGKLVVWAPDGQQEFPTGYGADGLLFTDDDPMGALPAGYSIVDLDETPFAISRDAEPKLELFEPKESAIKDYSDQSYTDAFESLFASVSRDWAFNGIDSKKVDWDALYKDIQPRVAQAERDGDADDFFRAVRAFIHAIPDGHTGISGGQVDNDDFFAATDYGYGLAIRELDNGKVMVVYVLPGGPADEAGIQVGASVTAFNGTPIKDAIGKAATYAGPFSMEISKRYQQARYLVRGSPNSKAQITFSNAGESAKTVTLTAVEERNSFAFTSIYRDAPTAELPVEYHILDSGVGYIGMYSYYDDLSLIITLFERALRYFQANEVTSIIIDMRFNGGGAPLGLAGFLTNQEIPLGQGYTYSEKTNQFEKDGDPDRVLPNQNQYRFDQIAILVGPACASACEQEAYSFAQVPNALVVGMYPSGGIFAEVSRGQYVLPEGIGVQIPTARYLLPDGSLFLEGTGVVPTVKVPIDETTVLSREDVVLQAAETALTGETPANTSDNAGPNTNTEVTVLNKTETQRAANSGAQVIESLAKEKYNAAEFSLAGRIYTYTVQLDQEEPLLWANGWCATDASILADNLKHIKWEFLVNDAPYKLDDLVMQNDSGGGLFCRTYFAGVAGWPSTETKLEIRVTFDTKINDGAGDYPAGTHSYLFLVTGP